MEKNAGNPLIGLAVLMVLCITLNTQCKTKKLFNEKDGFNKSSEVEMKYKSLENINNILMKLDGLGCGKSTKSNKSLGAILESNSSMFYCFRNTPLLIDTFRSVMNEITPKIEYNSNFDYIIFFEHIGSFNDPRSFEIALSLLKYDYTPDPNYVGDPVIEKVNHYVYWKLLIPHIKSVNNLSLEKSELFVPYEKFSIMSTEEFYMYMKDLWEAGKIELKAFGEK